ncbi:acyl-CoA thioesterase [Fulvivirga sp. 29W222]|uniref:Acyl-CoA thioesterase n=1 Tax=Fulvivirga marina TaxID=2494733 RepID=A0A937FYU3_9BACT|nr:thioesterase family protein [Fulvivirga marina]MBL6446991.1 acyl-CoA thioesterase [Fulvivirga marina]
MFEQTTQVRVRYAETDQMGYVYYGNYAAYYEVARVESLRSLGLSYKELEDQGIMMPVLENKSKYLAPAKYDELLTIKTTIKKKPAVRIQFDYEIYNESDKLIHIGETLLVFVDMKTGRPCIMPEVMANLLNPFFE